MDAISWYALGRTIGDPQSISEAIDVALLNHNLDPSAHSQSGEAIDEHRAAEILDHVAGSIHNEHVQDQNKTYDAIVDASGNADFIDIQDAIDHVAAHGGGTIFVRSGSYDVSEGLTLYSHIKIIGQDNVSTILHGVGDDLWLLIQGVDGTPIVDVLLQNLCFTELNVDDPYILLGYCQDITIDKCLFTFPDDPGWTPTVCIGSSGPLERIHITNNIFDNVAYALYLPVASALNVEKNYFINYTQSCVNTYNCDDMLIQNNYFGHKKSTGNPDAAIFAEGNSGNLRILGNIFKEVASGNISISDLNGGIICNNQILGVNSGDAGIQLSHATYSIISNNYINNVEFDGINLMSDSNRNTIVSNVCYTNHQYGIRIEESNCDKNIIVANVCYNNTSGEISDLGTGTVKANNVET